MSEHRRARLGRYSLWHLRDYLMEKGIGTYIVLALAVLLDYLAFREMSPLLSEDFLRERFATLTGTLALVGSLFATNGIVSDDRKNGYYRFLFAKPASVPAFYASKFAMHAVGLLIVGAAFLATYAVAFRPYLPASFLPSLALLFLGLGGIGFLLSATWRVDWLSLVVVYLVASVAWGTLRGSARWGWVPYLLPPVHELSAVCAAIAADRFPAWGSMTWITGYGLVCFLLGLVVLRFRPLASE